MPISSRAGAPKTDSPAGLIRSIRNVSAFLTITTDGELSTIDVRNASERARCSMASWRRRSSHASAVTPTSTIIDRVSATTMTVALTRRTVPNAFFSEISAVTLHPNDSTAAVEARWRSPSCMVDRIALAPTRPRRDGSVVIETHEFGRGVAGRGDDGADLVGDRQRQVLGVGEVVDEDLQ